MPNVTVRKADGSSAGDVVLSETLFGANVNPGLLAPGRRRGAHQRPPGHP